MNTQLALIALLTLAGITLFNQDSVQESLEMNSEAMTFREYQMWKSKYNKNHNADDDLYRFQVFIENKKIVEEFNAEQNGAELELNEFADRTNEEFAQSRNGVQYSDTDDQELEQNNNNTLLQDSDYPQRVDWSEQGAVSPNVPNQGECGSCWAFSTIASLEGLNAIQNGEFQYFSQQQLISCTYSSFILASFKGCDGARYPFYPWKYTQKNGIQTSDSYPYVQGEKGDGNQDPIPCNYNEDDVVFRHNSHVYVKKPTNEQVFQNVAIQPNSISMNANIFVQLYKTGVLSHRWCHGDFTNHAVTMVGYDVKPKNGDMPYFKIRNSWGPQYGENGYIRVQIDDTLEGTCGVKSHVSRPTNDDSQ